MLTPYKHITIMNFDVIDLLIRCFVFVRYWRKSWSIMGHCLSYLYILRKAFKLNLWSPCR